MPEIDKDAQKEILKEAINEWLDKQFAKLGKWTLGGICSAGLAALAYWILTSNGWHK
jgi:hypothetical protein